jgi:glycine dehydrogenase
MLAGEWERPYPRTTAVYPVRGLQGRSYLSPVRRIDQAYGDRNLVCSCPSPEAFAEHDFDSAPVPEADGRVPERGLSAPDDLGTTGDVVGAAQV